MLLVLFNVHVVIVGDGNGGDDSKDNDDLEIVRFIDERRRPPRKQQRG